ncbi:MAG TPA: inorganic phosphate transporter, partial [Chloroflexi bacterium]|nr:inorganic phosphate transporter [Chloroflexota bacterium]
MFYALLALALIYDFLNGFHDSANLVATAIYSRSIHPRLAWLLAAPSEFAGPFLFGVAAATTIGYELLDERVLQTPVILAALGAAVIWNLITWLLGIPSSSSHALLGGLLGAAIAFSRGVAIVRMPGLLHVI